MEEVSEESEDTVRMFLLSTSSFASIFPSFLCATHTTLPSSNATRNTGEERSEGTVAKLLEGHLSERVLGTPTVMLGHLA